MTTRTWTAALAAVTLTLAACGGDDGATAADDTGSATTTEATPDVTGSATTPTATATETATSEPDGTADASATADGSGTVGSGTVDPGPVTVEHRFGTTTIEAPPERIVSFDSQWTDVLVALDAPLVGALFSPDPEGRRFPWQEDIALDVEPLVYSTGIPYEAIAALQPDLIVVGFAALEQADYDRLSQIAPTIPLLSDATVDPWQEMAAVAGDVLGAPEQAAELVADAERQSAAVLAELPALEGRTYAMANYVQGDAIYVVADPDDGAGVFFAQLGMQIAPELLTLADSELGRATLSLERIDLLAADLLILLTNGVDPAEIPGYAALPQAQSGAVAILDAADASALNTPTPLSIPYVLDLIRPALEAAAG